MEKRYTSTLIDLRLQSEDVRTTREVQFVISTATRDRHKTVVNMDGWNIERFNANPIVGYQHNVYGDNLCQPNNPDDVLGPGRAWFDNVDGKKVLMGAVKFESEDINPLAEKIFKKVLNGTLRSTSVGFIELGKGSYGEKDMARGAMNETYFFEGQELIEFSIVNIPSNPDARARSIRNHSGAALGFIARLIPDMSIEQIKSMKVSELINAIEKGQLPIIDDEEKRTRELHELLMKEAIEAQRDLDKLTINTLLKF